MFGKFFDKLKGDSGSEKNSLPEKEYYQIDSFDNAIEYNNVIRAITSQCHDNISLMNYARDLNDYNLLEEARLLWLNDLDLYKNQIKSVGEYDNIDILYKAALKYISKIKDIINEGEKERVELLKSGRKGTNEEINLRDENNKKYKKAIKKLDESTDDFLACFDEFGTNISFGLDDISDEMKQYINPQEDLNDPMLEPIHGISLFDYAAGACHLANGIPENLILKALGVEKPIWDEAGQLWMKKMQMDPDFKITSLYGKYFTEAAQHPVLGNLMNNNQSSAGGSENITRIHNDEKYYYELAGARMAAYDAGLDGAQWILDNYGIPIGDFQSAAGKWMQNFQNIPAMMEYQDKMQSEYAKKFTENQGGNVADDIEF